MNGPGPVEALPVWLSRRVKRAAVSAALSQVWAIGAVCLLIAGIVAMLVLDRPQSMGAALFWLALFIALLIFFLYDAWKSLAYFFHPERSPETAHLKRFGALADVVASIEGELGQPGVLKLGEAAAVTSRWLVLSRGASFAVRRLDDLLWTFPKVEKVKLNGLIPIWTTHSAAFRFDGAPDAEIAHSQKTVTELIRRVAAARPAAFVGFDADLHKLWTTEPAQLAAIVRARTKKTA